MRPLAQLDHLVQVAVRGQAIVADVPAVLGGQQVDHLAPLRFIPHHQRDGDEVVVLGLESDVRAVEPGIVIWMP